MIPAPPEATPIPAPVEDPQLVYKEVLNDTFENAAGNSGLNNWQYASSESQLQVENGNHVLEMKIKEGFPWPELSRNLEMGIGGIIKVQYKLKMDALGTFKIVPRFYGGDSGKEIGEVFYDQVNNRLVIRTKDKDTHVYNMPGRQPDSSRNMV